MNRTNVELIKERIPIEELIASYVKLEKAGKSLKARCPFHNEKSASFFVSPERGGYYCFGCNAKGDIFTFVEQFEGLDFKGALKVLAEKAGVPLVVDQRADSERDRLFQITEEAAKFFEANYDRSTEAKKYICGRGVSPETRVAFRIGWAPEGWKNLFTYLKGKGWNEAFIEKAGLIKKAEARSQEPRAGSKLPAPSSNYYDRFRGRIIFPITDSSGRVVAFTGRILKDDGKSAKYLNSPDTPLFNKSQILFGLDKAKSEIRRVGYSILVEGQMDLILSHQVGVKNAVAASGTALTDQSQGQDGVVSNLGMVRRLSQNMIIALDSDKAGRTAAMRAVAATALSMGMSVKIADIEGGKDPADLILSDSELWKNVLKNAKHVIEFELENVLKETSDPHRLSRVIKERVFPFLARIESEMDKAYYVKIIAEKARLTEQAVWDDLRKFAKNQEPGARSQELGSQSSGNLTSSQLPAPSSIVIQPHRLDLVERRMFGLLALMDAAKLPVATDFRDHIKKIAGDSYETRIQRTIPLISDLSFEAEAMYGNDTGKFDVHMKELILNFEVDLINEELVSAMGALKVAEKEGNSARVSELAKKCQDLSTRKAGLRKTG
jgi:DNA primase